MSNVFFSFFQLPVTSSTKVLIYLSDSGDKTSGFGGSCTFIDDCQKTCRASPARCRSPQEITKIQTGGIWSRDEVNNPFANYFKVKKERKKERKKEKIKRKNQKIKKRNNHLTNSTWPNEFDRKIWTWPKRSHRQTLTIGTWPKMYHNDKH